MGTLVAAAFGRAYVRSAYSLEPVFSFSMQGIHTSAVVEVPAYHSSASVTTKIKKVLAELTGYPIFC